MTGLDRGAALIMAILTLALVAAVAAALALGAAGEALLAGEFARFHEGRYAADAGLARAIADLPAIDDWNALVNGAVASTFTDGPAAGVHTLADGSTLDMLRVASSAPCGAVARCPWRLFAYGPLASLLPAGSIRSTFYVVVIVAGDPVEADANRGALIVRADAFGPRGAHQIAQAVVERSPDAAWPIRTRALAMVAGPQ